MNTLAMARAETLETLRRNRSDLIDAGKRLNACMNALEITDRHAEAVQLGLVCGVLANAVHGLSEVIANVGDAQSC